jgi:NAD(P)H dehydrogenase (quinone)
MRQAAEIIPEEKWIEGMKATKEALKDIAVAEPHKDLESINGLVLAAPTRFGNMPVQMRNFWDQTTNEWLAGSISGMPAAFMSSTAT